MSSDQPDDSSKPLRAAYKPAHNPMDDPMIELWCAEHQKLAGLHTTSAFAAIKTHYKRAAYRR